MNQRRVTPVSAALQDDQIATGLQLRSLLDDGRFAPCWQREIGEKYGPRSAGGVKRGGSGKRDVKGNDIG
jgi:hypothetical protein